MQNLFVQTDIAELCEEVAEGSIVGKSHIDSDNTWQMHPSRRVSETTGLAEFYDDETTAGSHGHVAVVLDIDYQKDWVFITEPGAIRRILMNILGNSLKYTSSGLIQVHLKLQEKEIADGATARDGSWMMSIVVTDTGRGIARDFLRTQLFSPFTQEDHLSTGCGLGLSIVKSLVDSLKGNLEIRSQQNVSNDTPPSRYCGADVEEDRY
jgi:signal transduction histidine kinase